MPVTLPVPLNLTVASTPPFASVRRTVSVPVYAVPSTFTTLLPSLPKKTTF